MLSNDFEPFNLVNEGGGYEDPIYGYHAPGQARNGVTIPFCLRETRRRF
jgi:hypothetical protein